MFTFRVRLTACRFTLQGISLTHLFPTEHVDCERGPIVVSRMNDGNYFVHNGRHRVIRALMRGEKWAEARNLYDDGTGH